MPRSTIHRSSSPLQSSRSSVNLSRRQLLAGAGAGAAALLLEQSGVQAQATSSRTVVFSHTTVVTVDAVHNDVALAVEGDTIAAIGATDTIRATYPDAEIYDGRGKALLPGLINCHAHMAAVLARGFNEDFGFPRPHRPGHAAGPPRAGGAHRVRVDPQRSTVRHRVQH